MECQNCGIEMDKQRRTAKYCSPKCRVTASRKSGVVTDNVTLSEQDVTLNFKFYTITKKNGMGRLEDDKSKIREAKYWYDVPLAAIPVIEKDWPAMPDYMNGRQYFLWWKNNFKMNKDTPEILCPTPFL